MKRQWVVEKIQFPKRKKRLPVVLDLSEVQALFEETDNISERMLQKLSISSMAQRKDEFYIILRNLPKVDRGAFLWKNTIS